MGREKQIFRDAEASLKCIEESVRTEDEPILSYLLETTIFEAEEAMTRSRGTSSGKSSMLDDAYPRHRLPEKDYRRLVG